MTSSPSAPAQNGAGQTLFSSASFQQALEQQIAEAIEPVLAEFRQQLAQGVAPQAPEQAPAQEANAASEQDKTQTSPPSQQTPEGTAGKVETKAEVPVKNVAHVAQRQPSAALTAPLGQAVQAVEHLGTQWLQSILVAGLGALLAESTHATVRQHAEEGLHNLLQKVFDAVPNGTASKKMQDKTERTLQGILRDAIDAVFAEHVRASVQQGGRETIEKSLHGDLGGTLQKLRETLQVMAAALLEVLRRHQQTILRLLLAFALLALESSLVEPERAK